MDKNRIECYGIHAAAKTCTPFFLVVGEDVDIITQDQARQVAQHCCRQHGYDAVAILGGIDYCVDGPNIQSCMQLEAICQNAYR